MLVLFFSQASNELLKLPTAKNPKHQPITGTPHTSQCKWRGREWPSGRGFPRAAPAALGPGVWHEALIGRVVLRAGEPAFVAQCNVPAVVMLALSVARLRLSAGPLMVALGRRALVLPSAATAPPG